MVDENFYTAHKFIFLIALAYCFDGIRKLFQGYLIHLGKTKIFSLIIVFSACINIILNYVLLKRIRWVSGFLKCLHGKNRRGMCVINLCRFDATI
jgi:Na+-driven multidrug efflux pump